MNAIAVLPRRLEPEILDDLAPHDPDAMRSRRDLRRINRLMGSVRFLRKALWRNGQRAAPTRIIEFGAGDGTLMLRIAQMLAPAWPDVELTLLDRQYLIDAGTARAFRKLGWKLTIETADVMQWAAVAGSGHGQRWDVALANLFVHHFDEPAIALLFKAIADCSDAFIACEPRRDRLALTGSHLVGAIGANAVTRHDAVTSVKAGFRGRELSALWPGDPTEWTLEEGPSGLFSHCFQAHRHGARR